MSLLDFLRPQQAQTPGAMQQPQSGLGRLLDPAVALPMAAQLLGGQGNMQNLGNAFAAGGQGLAQQKQLQAQTAEKTKTLELLRKDAPDIARAVEGGLPVGEGWKAYLERRKAQGPEGYKVVGDQIFNTADQSWIKPPAAAGGEFRFGGNAVEAQALNGLIDSGQLTPEQAQQLAAGKTITNPADGSMVFMTPQGVFGQPAQGGQP